ncbi:PLP-dependent aminotransferase family protein [Bailinhaonella thermotolerans]|uniref:PLP-dependent aminotransferase family protein n=1 Tax=Bailinhaonella thermotolerans TaxID=1070861 RepID=A0A3A4ATW8_9ACTN|nr:PLP-dependent aminotransferase family protein [Bailinhaonella thermotolerans]RJL32863.1 PLP-dependent aminotransferase family protein [Bailinhaonella thermotolerans]
MRPLETLLGRWSSGRGPLHLLLATRLRQLIDDGLLPPGAPIPPDRVLAKKLAIGRTTVVAAYEVLRQEGRIVRRQGSGTRVAPAALSSTRRAPDGGGRNPLFLHLLEPPDDVRLLTCAAPLAPPPQLIEAHANALPRLAALSDDIGYHPAGIWSVRRAVAERYTRRGLPTRPEEILVVTGAQQALSLLARLLVAPGDSVVVEAPTYSGALDVFRDGAAALRPVPAGDVGAYTEAMDEYRPAITYLVPTFHNPTGSVLGRFERNAIVRTAKELDLVVIEDDVPAELSFHDDEPPPLAAGGGENVIQVGSLSKVVWGGFRIGWVRAAPALVNRLARLKAIHDLGSDTIAQLAAVELLPNLDEIRAERVARLREQHDHLCAELREHLPSWRFEPARGGQTLWVRLPSGDATSYAQVALRHGVAVLPGVHFDPNGGSQDALRVPFVYPKADLSDAVRRLARAWSSYSGGRGERDSLHAIVV